MDSPNIEDKDEPKASDSPQGSVHTRGRNEQATGPQLIRTDDPLISSVAAYGSNLSAHSSGTTIIETSRIRGPSEPFNPNFVMVPIEVPRSRQEFSNDETGGRNASHGRKDKGRKNQGGRDGNAKEDQSSAKKDDEGDDEQGESYDRHDEKSPGKPSQAPSLTRILLYSGLVALVCGVVGAWGYSYFFGSKGGDKNSSGNESGSSKGSSSNKGSDSSGGSNSGSDSGSSKNSDTSKGSSSNSNAESSSSNSSGNGADANRLVEAQKAWLAAVNDLHHAEEAEKAARQAEEEAKAVLDFLKNTLLSAGRPADASVTDAFWASGRGKDVMLRKAIDEAASKASEAFEDRPLAEASVRELLGLAYLNLGEPEQAVKQYERALAMREAEQGVTHPETAACRNQLAIAYRLARLPDEAARLFERNPNSPAHASALGIQGTSLLLEKKPAEAELKLRASLTIRLKIQPDDWTTFETKSLLGEALMDEGRFTDAEPLLLSGYEGMKQREDTIPFQDKPRLTKALRRLVKLYESWGKKDEAMKWRKEVESTLMTKK